MPWYEGDVAEQLRELISEGFNPNPDPVTDGTLHTAIAGATLSGHRIVRSTAQGKVVYADMGFMADAVADLWLTTQAVNSGEQVLLHTWGHIEDSSWSWSPGPIWLATNGLMTQTPPTAPAAIFLRQIGTSDGPSALFYNPQPAFVLA